MELTRCHLTPLLLLYWSHKAICVDGSHLSSSSSINNNLESHVENVEISPKEAVISNLGYSKSASPVHAYHSDQNLLLQSDLYFSDYFDEEIEMEEKLRTGNIPISEVPKHLLLHDEYGNPILPRISSRKLSPISANFSDFGSLECNPSSWPTCTNTVSLPSNSSVPLVIPCGECHIFDITGNVTINGIDIKGKLLFPTNHRVTINTPFVFIQGELEIHVNSPIVSPENQATKFVLTGTDDVIFNPTDPPNENACDLLLGAQCNMGSKPFLVAGGKINIIGMPETCATHTPILGKVYKDPVYDPVDFPTNYCMPSACPTSGKNFISYDFNDNDFGNFTGREGGFIVASDGTMKVTNRKLKDRGPYLDITPMHPELCLVPNQDYLFVAR